MLTLITESEALIKDRLLTYVTDDSNDSDPLTQSHLVFGYSLTSLPPLENKHLKGVGDDFTPSDLHKRLKCKYHVMDCFHQRLKREYLHSLREHTHTINTKIESVSVNDVVLIKDNNLRLLCKNGVLHKLKHIFPNTYQRIKSICSPAKGGTGCYRFNYQPGS